MGEVPLQGLGCGVWGLGFRVQGSEFRVSGLRLRVCWSRFRTQRLDGVLVNYVYVEALGLVF